MQSTRKTRPAPSRFASPAGSTSTIVKLPSALSSNGSGTGLRAVGSSVPLSHNSLRSDHSSVEESLEYPTFYIHKLHMHTRVLGDQRAKPSDARSPHPSKQSRCARAQSPAHWCRTTAQSKHETPPPQNAELRDRQPGKIGLCSRTTR